MQRATTYAHAMDGPAPASSNFWHHKQGNDSMPVGASWMAAADAAAAAGLCCCGCCCGVSAVPKGCSRA